jgi:two-component system, sensor histidine kinase RegB
MAEARGPGTSSLDRAPRNGAQGGAATTGLGLPALIGVSPRRERLRLRTLLLLRWMAIGGQLTALLTVSYGLGFQINLLPCLVLIAVSAAMNAWMTVSNPPQRMAHRPEAAAHIGFDILQLTGMLYFTGGIINPFSLLLIAPVTLAAATLPWRYAALLGGMAIAAGFALAVWYLPLPWSAPGQMDLPLLYRVGLSVATAAGVAFTAAYAGYAAAESARMEIALHVAETVLAREQRLSALGGLAAAAAHELGTPLATITLVAKELARETTGAVKEDADLLVSQAQRCRDILRSLSETPDTTDAVHARMSLAQLLQEVTEPYSDIAGVEVIWNVAGRGETPPELRRLAEVVHALASFVENAVDFAATEVRVIGRFDDESITVEVSDDGDGFAPEIFAKLGEPYVTSRPGAEGSRTGHEGMGLGFFIAKTLLERTGATVDFRNARQGGAVVSVRWPRAAVEANGD